jgi:hypothetical protein
VTHADYATLDVRGLAVGEETPVEGLKLKLPRGSVVYGWIKGLDGEFQADVRVFLTGSYSTPPAITPKTAPEAQGKTPGEVRFGYHKEAQTDYRGRYRFEHVPGGGYSIWIDYLATSLPQFKLEADEEKEINIDLSEAGTVAGRLQVPPDSEEVRFTLSLEGMDGMATPNKRVSLDDENAFEAQGVFPGKYRLCVYADRKDPEGGRSSFRVTTDPHEIIIEVPPSGKVTQDITITKIKERE